eukprot:6431868-Heterocapsa_arctica.AAC.1
MFFQRTRAAGVPPRTLLAGHVVEDLLADHRGVSRRNVSSGARVVHDVDEVVLAVVVGVRSRRD